MLYEKCLSIIYNDKQLLFTELPNQDSSVSINIRNIRRLAIEMFRFYNGLSPPLKVNNIFQLRTENFYNLRLMFLSFPGRWLRVYITDYIFHT